MCKEQEARIAELLDAQTTEDDRRLHRERRLSAVEAQLAQLQRSYMQAQERLLAEQSEREALQHEVQLHEERYGLLQRKHDTMRERCLSLEATCRDLLRASAPASAQRPERNGAVNIHNSPDNGNSYTSPRSKSHGRLHGEGEGEDTSAFARPAAPLLSQSLRSHMLTPSGGDVPLAWRVEETVEQQPWQPSVPLAHSSTEPPGSPRRGGTGAMGLSSPVRPPAGSARLDYPIAVRVHHSEAGTRQSYHQETRGLSASARPGSGEAGPRESADQEGSGLSLRPLPDARRFLEMLRRQQAEMAAADGRSAYRF